ncbi:hypothetical protein KSP40_PGU008475 [Platanthera guangdongensis]|uniref:Uncharacterized protein n=1 Tax=Platanthera guangdongensis TaxID=2320717 RepID=A0ABR2MYM9_9ASPA
MLNEMGLGKDPKYVAAKHAFPNPSHSEPATDLPAKRALGLHVEGLNALQGLTPSGNAGALSIVHASQSISLPPPLNVSSSLGLRTVWIQLSTGRVTSRSSTPLKSATPAIDLARSLPPPPPVTAGFQPPMATVPDTPLPISLHSNRNVRPQMSGPLLFGDRQALDTRGKTLVDNSQRTGTSQQQTSHSNKGPFLYNQSPLIAENSHLITSLFSEISLRLGEIALIGNALPTGEMGHFSKTISHTIFITKTIPFKNKYPKSSLFIQLSAEMAQYMKLAAVIARASRWSETWPAKTPPNTPPTSNNDDNIPAVESDRYSPPMTIREEKMKMRSTTSIYDILALLVLLPNHSTRFSFRYIFNHHALLDVTRVVPLI